MANLIGNGAPTKRTRGHVGDFYTDTKTGEEYKCIFAYRSDTEYDFECEWKKTGKVFSDVKSEIPKKVDKVDVKVEKTEDIRDEQRGQKKQAHKDYTTYSKKNK